MPNTVLGYGVLYQRPRWHLLEISQTGGGPEGTSKILCGVGFDRPLHTAAAFLRSTTKIADYLTLFFEEDPQKRSNVSAYRCPKCLRIYLERQGQELPADLQGTKTAFSGRK